MCALCAGDVQICALGLGCLIHVDPGHGVQSYNRREFRSARLIINNSMFHKYAVTCTSAENIHNQQSRCCVLLELLVGDRQSPPVSHRQPCSRNLKQQRYTLCVGGPGTATSVADTILRCWKCLC